MEQNNGGLEDDVPLHMGEFLAKRCWLSAKSENQARNSHLEPNFFWWQWFIRCLSETESSGKKKRDNEETLKVNCSKELYRHLGESLYP